MGRAGSIAAVIAASGILVAGAGISVYAINTSLATAAPQQVVAESTSAAPQDDPSTDDSAVTAEDLQVDVNDDDLIVPDFTMPPTPATAQTQAAPQAATAPQSAATASTRKAHQRATTQSTSAQAGKSRKATQPRGISVSSARTIAARAAKGRVIGMWYTRHNGFSCIAAKVLRGDGSIVVAYIDRPTGAVIDWTLVRAAHSAAPAPQPAAPQTHSAEPTVEPTPTPTPTPSRHEGTWSGQHNSGTQWNGGQTGTQSGGTQTGGTQSGGTQSGGTQSGGTQTTEQHNGSDD